MYCSPTVEKGRAWCPLHHCEASVWMGAPSSWLSSWLGTSVSFCRGGWQHPWIGLPGWVQCPEAVVLCCGRRMTMASSLHPNLKLFANFLLLVGFAFCWLFCLIGSFASISLSHLAANPYPQSNNLLGSRPTRGQVDLGTGLTLTGPRKEVHAKQLGAWHPGTPWWAERANRKWVSLCLAIFCS